MRTTLKAGVVALLGAVALSPSATMAQQQGGTVVVGLNSSIAVPDPHFFNTQRDTNFWPHVFEALMVFGDGLRPTPQLARSYEVSDDGLTYTFRLREGVLFHNGDTMTSADVVASWERHIRISPGRTILAAVSGLSAPDDNTFVVTLARPQPLFIEAISATNFPLVIMPAAESVKEQGQLAVIGTGPYRFVEFVPDDRTVIERFDDYVADTSHPEGALPGLAGHRRAHIDRIIFRAIPESGTRIAALQTGELTIADNLPVPASVRLTQPGAGFAAHDVMPFSKAAIPLHSSNPPTDNVLVRRAIQAALNPDDIMEIALEGFYELDPSLVFRGSLYYPGDAVASFYNQNNPARAAELLREAGYAGEPIRILTNTNFAFMQNMALVMSEQLKAAGMNVSIEVTDWPTNLSAIVDGSDRWNLTPIGYGSQPLGGPPAWIPVIRQHSQVKGDARYDELSSAWLNEPSLERRQDLWREIETHVNEQAYILMAGDRGIKVVATDKLKGYAQFYSMRFWNTWLE